VSSNKVNVLWVVDDQTVIKRILHIFDRYPPLTSRVTLQLRFMRHCFDHHNIDQYFNERELIFDDRLNVINRLSNVDLLTLSYYRSWLSGFMEAESSFSVRNEPHTDVHSFSIGQNNDKYLIESIKYYFKATNVVREPYTDFYSLEIFAKEALLRIYDHIHHYPLLGHKRSQVGRARSREAVRVDRDSSRSFRLVH